MGRKVIVGSVAKQDFRDWQGLVGTRVLLVRRVCRDLRGLTEIQDRQEGLKGIQVPKDLQVSKGHQGHRAFLVHVGQKVTSGLEVRPGYLVHLDLPAQRQTSPQHYKSVSISSQARSCHVCGERNAVD